MTNIDHDSLEQLQSAARELPHVQNNLDLMRARATVAEAELREARATIDRLESVILSSAGRMFDKNGGAGVPLDRLLTAMAGPQ